MHVGNRTFYYWYIWVISFCLSTKKILLNIMFLILYIFINN